MFALVIFSDEILFICNISDISVCYTKSSVKYRDNRRYEARVLAVCNDQNILHKIKENLESNKAFVGINFIDYEDAQASYDEAVENLSKNNDREIAYIEKSLLALESVDNSINTFSLEPVNLQQDFFDKAACFVKLRAVYNKRRSFPKKESRKKRKESKKLKTNNNDMRENLSTENTEKPDCDDETAKKVENSSKPPIVQLNETYTINLSSIELSTTEFNISQFQNDSTFVEKSSLCDNNGNINDLIKKPIEFHALQSPDSGNVCKPRIIEDKILTLPKWKILPGENKTTETPFSDSIFDNNFDDIFHALQGNELNNNSDSAENTKHNNELDRFQSMNLQESSPPIGHSTIDEVNLTSIENVKDVTVSHVTDNVSGQNDEDLGCDFDYEPERDALSSEDSFSDIENRTFEISKRDNFHSLNITLGIGKNKISAPDDRDLKVEDSETTETKRHCCIYCNKLQTKIARHLENVHGNEDDVKKFCSLPAGSRERQEIIGTLRKNGDHIYNTNRNLNTGTLLVCRRPNKRMKKNAEDFLSCGNCKGQYARSVLRHHWRKCTKRDGKRERIIVVKGRKVAARLHEKASIDVRKYIFPYMREDEIVRGIRYDELIVVYANKQCQKYCSHQHLYQMIRARLRLLGRFLDAIKKINNRVKEFSDVFQPRFYDAAIAAVRIVAKFNERKRVFEHPAVASNLGTILKQVGEVLRSEHIKKEMENEQKKVDDFLKLLAEDYGVSINKVVAETQTQNNRRKKVELPTTDDIKKLHSYLKTERKKNFELLQRKYSYERWRKLAETTLLSMQLFNRRRPGEIERLYLDDFLSYRGIDENNQETYNALSEEGKKLAREYVRFEIRGKLGRGVPVLIYTEILSSLKLLIQYRTEAGVPEANQYLFGLPSNDEDRCRYLRACDLMRDYARNCGAKIPTALRGTKLRKHIATRCINLNLSDGQVDRLANFMGHDPKIHKAIYQQPELEADIVKISKILKTAQGFDVDSSDDSDSQVGMSSNKSRYFSDSSIRLPQRTVLKSSASKRWSHQEREIVLSAFKGHLTIGKIPTGIEIQQLIDAHDCLKSRTVAQLRTWLHTQRNKNK